mmetsp:Transcript_18160/g.57054  ORF Transcript_18160/g.57054 Transcript_18160/m.57054 type:complete len:291 (-) Transcript_18160:1870-2742(-)
MQCFTVTWVCVSLKVGRAECAGVSFSRSSKMGDGGGHTPPAQNIAAEVRLLLRWPRNQHRTFGIRMMCSQRLNTSARSASMCRSRLLISANLVCCPVFFLCQHPNLCTAELIFRVISYLSPPASCRRRSSSRRRILDAPSPSTRLRSTRLPRAPASSPSSCRRIPFGPRWGCSCRGPRVRRAPRAGGGRGRRRGRRPRCGARRRGGLHRTLRLHPPEPRGDALRVRLWPRPGPRAHGPHRRPGPEAPRGRRGFGPGGRAAHPRRPGQPLPPPAAPHRQPARRASSSPPLW